MEHVLHHDYRFLPLEQYITASFNNNFDFKFPNITLSKLTNIPKNYIEIFENAGIYDFEDFNLLTSEEISKLKIPLQKFDELKKLIFTEIKSLSYPKIILKLPENYALISIESDKFSNSLSIIWGNILFNWENPIDEGWSLIKHSLNSFIVDAERPELIGSLEDIQKKVNWLNNVSDISTYLSGIYPTISLHDQVLKYGFPVENSNLFSSKDRVDYKVIQLKFLVNLALYYSH